LITDFVDIKKNAPDEFSAIKLCFVSHKTMTYKTYPHFAVIYRIRKPSFITSEGRNLSLLHKIASLRTLKFAGYKKSNTFAP